LVTDLWVMGVSGRHQRRVLRGFAPGGYGGTYRPYAWSADSRRLATSMTIVTVRDRRRVNVNVDAENPSFAPDGRHLVADFGDHGTTVELIDPRKPNKFVGLGGGDGELWRKPGVAFVGNRGIILVPHPGASAPRRVLFSGAGVLADWSPTGSRLLAGAFTFDNATGQVSPIEPFLIDPYRGTVQRLPQALSTLYRVSRDGRTVLGQLGNDVVLERADGTVKILAHNADSATWTA